MRKREAVGLVGIATAVLVVVATVVALWVSDDLTSARATALSTIVLAVVTAFYAVEATKTRRQMRAQWSEELADRKAVRNQEAFIARQSQSRDTARRILDRFREVHAGELGSARVSDDVFVVAADAIDADSFEIHDTELRDRLAVARLVSFAMEFPDSEFQNDRGDNGKGFAVVLANLTLSQAREGLEAHVAGRALPAWINLPQPLEAQAWLINSARTGKNTLE